MTPPFRAFLRLLAAVLIGFLAALVVTTSTHAESEGKWRMVITTVDTDGKVGGGVGERKFDGGRCAVLMGAEEERIASDPKYVYVAVDCVPMFKLPDAFLERARLQRRNLMLAPLAPQAPQVAPRGGPSES